MFDAWMKEVVHYGQPENEFIKLFRTNPKAKLTSVRNGNCSRVVAINQDHDSATAYWALGEKQVLIIEYD